MYKKDLELNHLQWLICHQTKLKAACVQRNDYYLIEIITWNHTTLSKLFLSDRNNQYITVKKTLKKQLQKNISMNATSRHKITLKRLTCC